MAYNDLDLKIINRLLEDGRASLRSIAEELGVSVTTVSNHIKAMEKDGIIKGFKPVLDYSELGYTVTCVLMIKAEGEGVRELTEKLVDKEYFTNVYEVTGDFDFIATGKFKDTETMNRAIKDLLNDPNVRETNTNVVLSTVKEESEITPY